MFDKIKKLFNKGSIEDQIKHIKTKEDIKIFGEKYIKLMSDEVDQLEKDYHNKNNYPQYQQEYYSFNKEINNLNTLDEVVLFHKRVNNLFNHLKEVYDKTNLNEKEKTLVFYNENYEYEFLNNYYKLLRKIGNKYKKFGEINLAYDIFLQILGGATQDIENYTFLLALRISDLNFLEKQFIERKEYDLLEFIRTIKLKLNQIKDKEREKIEKLILENGIEKTEQAMQYFKKYNERGYKKANCHNDDVTCEICKKNDLAGRIYADLNFPSGHQTYPFHKGCRCNIVYRLFKPDDERLI